MNQKEMDALLHELRCRDEYALNSSGEQFALRELWEDLPQEREALKTLWGPLFPDDLAGVLVLAFGAGTGFAILNMPLSQAEYERWDAASHAIDVVSSQRRRRLSFDWISRGNLASASFLFVAW